RGVRRARRSTDRPRRGSELRRLERRTDRWRPPRASPPNDTWELLSSAPNSPIRRATCTTNSSTAGQSAMHLNAGFAAAEKVSGEREPGAHRVERAVESPDRPFILETLPRWSGATSANARVDSRFRMSLPHDPRAHEDDP